MTLFIIVLVVVAVVVGLILITKKNFTEIDRTKDIESPAEEKNPEKEHGKGPKK